MTKLVKIALGILFIVAIVGVGSSIYFYTLTKNTKNSEVEELVAQVEKLILLPEDEIPTVATVADLEELKDQPFFFHAKVGDKVLLYNNAKKAYLYNPVDNKIIEVAPIGFGNETILENIEDNVEDSVEE